MTCSFWAFLYVQNRHDICKETPISEGTVLTVCSTGSELHYSYHCFPDSRTAYDLGILWYELLQLFVNQISNYTRLPKPPWRQRS